MNKSLSVRMSAADRQRLEEFRQARGVTTAEALRVAIMIGLPLAHQSTTLNVPRLTALLEFIAGGIGIMIRENHSEYEDDLKRMVDERVERYHS